jgi:hypothetical protein
MSVSSALFDGEHGPFVVVLVGALFVGSMSTVWHGQITPGGRVPGRAVSSWRRGRSVAAARRRARHVQYGIDRDRAVAARRARWDGAATGALRVGVGQGWVHCRHMSASEHGGPRRRCRLLRLRAATAGRDAQFLRRARRAGSRHPALVRHAVTDVHIHSARVELPGHGAPLYLHTSPEYAMKRLLAAGSGDIFQIAHVFRGEETSRWHNAEFTLIEWYRCGYSMANS